MPTKRRRFLQSAATVAAGFAVSCDNSAETQTSSETSGSAAPASTASTGTLSKVRFGKYELSRLIVGGNPFYGYSHFNRLFSAHMVEWATPE